MGRAAIGLVVAAVLGAGCTGFISEPGEDEPGGGGGKAAGKGGLGLSAPTIHRLTRAELHNSWLDLLGEPLELPAELPSDDQLYGFSSIASAGATVSALDAEKYETATYAVLDQVWSDAARRDALVGCAPTSMAESCVRTFVKGFTERAWRRPAQTSELESILSLGELVAADLADASQGLKFALASVLQSPHFLFRVELGEPEPKRAGFYRYTSWEMASRLSYLILDAPPDAELIEAAKDDALRDPERLALEAGRLLGDPRARPALKRFFRDFMNIGKLDQLDKSPEKFPIFTPTLGPAMREEIERMFETVVFDQWQGDFRQLFTTRTTFVNGELAALYGIDDVTGSDFVQVELPSSSKRAGVLTTAGFLAQNAHKTQTSPTHRGRFVRIQLLCQDVPPPPPGVNTALPEPVPGELKTFRQQLEFHRENQECKSCHEKMDPIGFAYENFDAIGKYRTEDENGLPIDAATEIEGQPVNGPVQAAALFAEMPEVGACVARRFYEHAGGHLAEKTEEPAVKALVERFQAEGYDFKQLVIALVENEGFRFAASPESETP